MAGHGDGSDSADDAPAQDQGQRDGAAGGQRMRCERPRHTPVLGPHVHREPLLNVLPFHGLHVLEIGSYLAAPLACTHLSDLGSKVTSVQRPAGSRGARTEDRWRPETAEALSTGKTLVTLDLKTEEGQLLLAELIRSADVVVVGFSTAAMSRLGIDRESCHALNPDLVHAHMPGFASTDAEFAELEAWEATILAASGVLTGMGLNRQLAGKAASYTPLPLASAYASITAALAITAALCRREAARAAGESGLKLHMEVPLASALLDALVHNSLQYEVPSIYRSRRQRALGDPRPAPLDYFETLDLTDPFYSHYACSDARPFYIVAPCHLRHQKNAIQVLGIEQQVKALGVPLAATYGDAGHTAPRHGLGAGQVGDAWAAPLRALIRRAFLTLPSYEWEARFGAAGVPGTAHRTTVEWLDSPHVREAGLVREEPGGRLRPGAVAWVVEEELGGTGQASRPPPSAPPMKRAVSCNDSAGARRPTAPLPMPVGGQPAPGGLNTTAPEARDHDERCRLGRTGPWLSGLSVLDLANVIAGPTIGAMLARFGADVIKIDPPRPTYSPEVTVLYGLAANAGKRSVLLDVRPPAADSSGDSEPSGRAAFEQLVRRADVVVYNGTVDALARLGLTPADLTQINPGVILSRFDAYGGPNEGKGARANHLGYDDNLQAALGIMERFGGGLGRVEEHAHVGTIDVAAGIGGALATAAAVLLRERRRSGALPTPARPTALVARASLASVGQMVQYPFCCGTRAALTLEGATSRTRLGPECEGEHALLHCYKAADGSWLMLTATLLPLSKLPAAEAAATLHKLAAATPALRAAVAAGEAPSVRFSPPVPAEASAEDDRLCAALRRAFGSSGSASWWVQQLGAAGVRAVKLASFGGLREACTKPAAECNVDLSSDAKTFQFLRHQGHAMGGDLVMFAPCSVRTCGGEGLMVPLHDAPRYGEHTVQVLRSVGADWRALVARKQAATRWCSSYLPGAASADSSAAGRPLGKAAASKRASSHPHLNVSAVDLVASPSDVLAETGIPAITAVALDVASCGLSEPTSPRAGPAPPPDSCPICLDVMIRPVGLACSHQLCADCATKCSSAGLASCPVCRHPQLLDPAVLARRSQAWRAAYSGWRRGAPTGSQGEFGSINAPAAATAETLRGNRLVDSQVCCAPSAAGDLAICKKAPPPPGFTTAKGGGDQPGSADAFKPRGPDHLLLGGFVGMLSKPKRSFLVSASQRMPLQAPDGGHNSDFSLVPTCPGSPEQHELV